MTFEIGQTYSGKDGNLYTVKSIDKNNIQFMCNGRIRYFKVIKYCGIDAAIQYGVPFIMSGKIIPVFDPEIDIKIKPKTDIKINTNNEEYINVFKEHFQQ